MNTTANLTQEQFDAISAQMLVAVDDVFIYDENGPIQHDGYEEPGAKTVAFNRPTLPNPGAAAFTESSRRLTDGTDIGAANIALAMTQVQLTYREYAGPHDGVAVKPFAYTNYLKRMAKHDIVPFFGGMLGRDRRKWINTVWQNALLAATNVVVVGGVAEGAVTANQPMTRAYLALFLKAMQDAKVPTYANGHYRMAITTKQLMELKNDAQIRASLDQLAGSNPLFRGHVGSFEGFDFLLDTTMPTKGVGGAGAVTGYQCIAWGPLGLGHHLVQAPEVREDDNTDFKRRRRMIWDSIEAVGTLYPDLIFRGITT